MRASSWLFAAIAFTLWPAAKAQNAATVSASVSGYTALQNRPLVEADQVPITVTRADGPTHAEASGDGGVLFSYPINFGDASASSVAFAAADPGTLHIFGGVRTVATDVVFPMGIPSQPSTFNVAAGVLASASFTDYLTIGSASLAFGSLVHIPMTFLAEIVSNYPLGYPQFSAHTVGASVSFNIPGFGPQNFSTESGFFPWRQMSLGNNLTLYSIRSDDGLSFEAHVGDVLPIGAGFSVFGSAAITDTNRETDVGGFVDGRDTAAFWLGALPDGVTVTSASGHDYTTDPTAPVAVSAVPEPESYALLLAGLGALAFRSRRCRARPAQRG